jgi:hypothetical protein
MSRSSQLNALTRLAMYFILVCLMFNQPPTWIQFAVIFIIFLIFLYLISVPERQQDNINQELLIENPRRNLNYEEYTEYKNRVSKKPTPDNPLMNPTLTDISLGPEPMPANTDDVDIKEGITHSYNDKLYRDIDDLYERENSQRQFYTMPKLYPNDQTGFANWLYNSSDICKVNPGYCYKENDDLRFRRINQGIVGTQ